MHWCQLHTFVIHLLPVDLSTGDVHQVELANEHGEEGLQRVGERRECSSFSPEHQVAAHRERHEHDAEDHPKLARSRLTRRSVFANWLMKKNIVINTNLRNLMFVRKMTAPTTIVSLLSDSASVL